MDISGADPSVIQTADGYVSVESRGGRRIMVRVAPDLAGLATAKPQRIWSDPEQLGAVWAPEILFRNGQYEVYFTAGVDEFHRMYVIKSDQPAADYGEATEIVLPDDKWAIDGLPFTYQGADYFIWSGWQGDTDVQQDLFIAAMNEDDEIISPRAAIATPDDAWENIAGETPSINEGPQPILDPAGQLHIVYSANGSWGENYCLSDLRLIVGGDPLVAEDWRESNGCLFGANPATLADGGTLAEEAKGVGHHSFVLPDGALEQPADPSQPIAFIYHGVPAAQEPANFWEAREWYVGSAQWVPDIVYGSGQLGDTGWSLKFSE
jgi:GH43 family beta-xylosidase